MINNRRFGIGYRIGGLVSLAVVVAVVVVTGIMSAQHAVNTAREKRSSVEGTAYVFASAVADHIIGRDTHAIQTVLRSIDRVPGVVSATVHDSTGQVLATLGQAALLTSEIIPPEATFWNMFNYNTVPVPVSIVKNGKTEGTLVLVTDISDLRKNFAESMYVVAGAAVFAAIVSVLLSLPLQKRIAAPIQSLTAAMQQLRKTKDYTVTFPAGGKDETGVLIESFNSLISDIHMRDLALKKLAYFDPLTGLANMASFKRELGESIDKAERTGDAFAAIQINVNNFSVYSDAFGHPVGNGIVLSVASVINSEVGDKAFVARIGTNEFGIIAEDSGRGNATRKLITRIEAALAQPQEVLGMQLHLTITAGITLLPRDCRNAEDVLRQISLASKEAKKQQTSVCFFHSDMVANVKKETEFGQQLRFAIEKNELEVHYQPQLQLNSQAIPGFEALARWKHPVDGYVGPAVFIPIAERGGSISAIGEWVMLTGCRQARKWIDEGHPLRAVSVNISPAQVLQPGFVQRVKEVLEEADLPPELLCLELTESLFIGLSLDAVRPVLNEISTMGVSLALDDFGTGYSSLSYLSQLPFDKLKIDKSFVISCQNSPKRIEILRAIIQMAKGLGMEVIAEGAETQAELALLVELKADQVQGYIVARPTPAAEALEVANAIEHHMFMKAS